MQREGQTLGLFVAFGFPAGAERECEAIPSEQEASSRL
jgi:hypothetical protein